MRRVARLRLFLAIQLFSGTIALAQSVTVSPTAKGDQVDHYFGVTVADPYRWLEDATSPDVARWVTAQNAATFSYLDQIPFRARLRQRLDDLYNYPKYSSPARKGPYYVFSKNDGLQNQSVVYIQNGIDEEPRVLLDPNTFSADGTVKLAGMQFTRDGRYFAYGMSRGGSDWRDFFVRVTATGEELSDHIRWAKVTGTAWYGDGFFYSRYDAPADTLKALSAKNENHKVYYHRLRTDQSADELIFEDVLHPLRFHTLDVTEDERYQILYVSDRGTGKDGNAVYLRDALKEEKTFRPIVTTFDDDVAVIDNFGKELLVRTNRRAQRYRLVLIDPDHPGEEFWKDVLPEQPEPLQSVSSIGGKVIAVYLKDVSHRVYVYDRSGRRESEISLPTLGTVGGFGGESTDTTTFYTFTSFTYPPTTYRYNMRTGVSTLFRRAEVKFTPDHYETKQVFYPSNDGTQIPMFIVHKKGLVLDGQRPTLLYGYGGFNISELPGFSTTRIALLEQGVVYAVANIRGGGEYGEEWHRAAMVLKRQTAFDDFIAAGEWLKSNGYTSSERLAIWGISNGGLLVGAVMTQRPDLAKVALPQVGVMDMLRYHKFTIGWNWKPDFGSSEDSVEFRYLYAYSPLHNLKKGVSYPATLVTTADYDDRVVPAHSFKFIATLQEIHAGPNPTLIRIDTRSGHGASNVQKALDATADLYAFMLYNLGVPVNY